MAHTFWMTVLQGHFHELLSALRQIQQPRGGISSFLLGMLFTMLAIASSAFLAYAWYMERQHKQQLRSAAEVSDTLDGRRLKEIVGEVRSFSIAVIVSFINFI